MFYMEKIMLLFVEKYLKKLINILNLIILQNQKKQQFIQNQKSKSKIMIKRMKIKKSKKQEQKQKQKKK